MAIVMLDDESARWARFMLRERAEILKGAAADARRYAVRHIPAAKAANFIAERYERAARELLSAIDEINPNPGGEAGRLYRSNP